MEGKGIAREQRMAITFFEIADRYNTQTPQYAINKARLIENAAIIDREMQNPNIDEDEEDDEK
jgi:hypothetical protein